MAEDNSVAEARASELYKQLEVICGALAKQSLELFKDGVEASDASYRPIFGEAGVDKAVIAVFANDQAASMLRVVTELLKSGADIVASIKGPIAAMWLDGWANGYQWRAEHDV